MADEKVDLSKVKKIEAENVAKTKAIKGLFAEILKNKPKFKSDWAGKLSELSKELGKDVKISGKLTSAAKTMDSDPTAQLASTLNTELKKLLADMKKAKADPKLTKTVDKLIAGSVKVGGAMAEAEKMVASKMKTLSKLGANLKKIDSSLK